jgi:hypothetical protein
MDIAKRRIIEWERKNDGTILLDLSRLKIDRLPPLPLEVKN